MDGLEKYSVLKKIFKFFLQNVQSKFITPNEIKQNIVFLYQNAFQSYKNVLSE